jgi:signal transduction histidine kinase
MRGTLDADQLERATTILVDASDRLTRLTQDLVDVGRVAGGDLDMRPADVDMVELVRVAADQLRPSLESHQLDVDAPDRPVFVRADRARIGQVLGNLLDNAVKYSPAGGTIRMRLTPDDVGVTVAVTDPGIGLPEGASETVFEPFGRASNAKTVGVAGMGLGLHVSRAIVERHGGRIRAESAGEGQGTTVSFWLPRPL